MVKCHFELAFFILRAKKHKKTPKNRQKQEKTRVFSVGGILSGILFSKFIFYEYSMFC